VLVYARCYPDPGHPPLEFNNLITNKFGPNPVLTLLANSCNPPSYVEDSHDSSRISDHVSKVAKSLGYMAKHTCGPLALDALKVFDEDEEIPTDHFLAD
jgi:hypothetical protein